MRTLFDAMMGMYQYGLASEYEISHTTFMILHIYIANIFLLNYLVAILSTVYEEMMEKGEFKFKCYRYKYIERYKIAFQDKTGLSELVMHAPPFNLGLVVLLPAMFKTEWMVKYSLIYSKVVFWVENIFFMVEQLLYELMLVPVIFFKIMINVIKLAEGFQKIQLLVFWLFGGIFYLIYGIFLDMYYFFRILKNYKIDEDEE
jgi:hypothetical protein